MSNDDCPYVEQLHVGMSGPHVAAYQRMLHRWDPEVRPQWEAPYMGQGFFGQPMRDQVKRFQASWSSVHGDRPIPATGYIGPLTHAALLRSADARACWLLRTEYERRRGGEARTIVTDAARKALARKGRMTYSGPKAPAEYQRRRWQGIKERIVPPSVPQYADCSSLASWCLWLARDHGAEDPSRSRWTWGNTTSMEPNGRKVDVGSARPGALFFYFRPKWGGHVGIMVERAQGVPWLVSFGQQGGPYYVRWDYRRYKGRVDLTSVRDYIDDD